MTRAMDTLILTRAVYRRRYGTDMPEASVPSRFLEEIPPSWWKNWEARDAPRGSCTRVGTGAYARAGRAARHSSRDSLRLRRRRPERQLEANQQNARAQPSYSGTSLQLHRQHCRVLRLARKEVHLPKVPVEEPKGKKGFRPGQKVRHPKYGEGTVYQREGDGEDAKITVQFPRFGLKKLVEKYAQLERA